MALFLLTFFFTIIWAANYRKRNFHQPFWLCLRHICLWKAEGISVWFLPFNYWFSVISNFSNFQYWFLTFSKMTNDNIYCLVSLCIYSFKLIWYKQYVMLWWILGDLSFKVTRTNSEISLNFIKILGNGKNKRNSIFTLLKLNGFT